MPFRGRDLSLVVLLPPATGTLRQLEDQLSAENLESWMGSLRVQETSVWFPKYSFSSKCELRDDLVALGMPAAFQGGSADFSGMDGTRAFSLSQVYHEAFIKVDEVGAEAAAGTGGAPPPSLPFMFTADHPFLFLIYDHVTHSVLFFGRVVRPVG
jgi:serpin B